MFDQVAALKWAGDWDFVGSQNLSCRVPVRLWGVKALTGKFSLEARESPTQNLPPPSVTGLQTLMCSSGLHTGLTQPISSVPGQFHNLRPKIQRVEAPGHISGRCKSVSRRGLCYQPQDRCSVSTHGVPQAADVGGPHLSQGLGFPTVFSQIKSPAAANQSSGGVVLLATVLRLREHWCGPPVLLHRPPMQLVLTCHEARVPQLCSLSVSRT
ncbi:hypothetical protein NDU88_004468 [Pleurodeles waltl]|uniref:Uncharacterized protein n=1 Tax=Pleurodeles waltl TaxID=8319 RepID=A0AAV7RI89_PLEWA|nr:hypothetical protein NDU88_004468 [Pleurodeles waltl]